MFIFHCGTGKLETRAIISACVHADMLSSPALKIHESHSLQTTLKTALSKATPAES